MIPLDGTFDAILAALLIWLAWQSLTARALFTSIVLFIAFGLCVSLAWVRLNAPDVALAEAAIGAGLTGALFLSALASFETPHAASVDPTEEELEGEHAAD